MVIAFHHGEEMENRRIAVGAGRTIRNNIVSKECSGLDHESKMIRRFANAANTAIDDFTSGG